MPIHGYPGNVITANPTAPTVSSASGVWTTEQQLINQSAGRWPMAATQISRSLRFNSADSAYLNRTPGSASNRKTWTWSGWVKRSNLGTSVLFSGVSSGNDATILRFTSDQLQLQNFVSGSFNGNLITTAVYRDVSAWYHIVAVWDSANATSGDRMRLYVNGSEVTVFSTDSAPTQNTNGFINNTNGNYLGVDIGFNNQYFNGYLTETNFIDGLALDPSYFGFNDSNTGVWTPRQYTGAYGTNGFYVNFSDNSGTTSTTLGKDYSGNGNNWTPNNFSVTAGAGNDSLVDTPTSYGTDTGVGGEVRGNYATLNPISNPNGPLFTLSNGNLDYSCSASSGNAPKMSVTSSIAMSSGKWYCEATETSSNSGFGVSSGIISGGTANGPQYAIAFGSGGASSSAATYSGTSPTFTTNDRIGLALDADARTLAIYKNGTLQGTFSGLESSVNQWFFIQAPSASASASSAIWNFGQRAFAYTAPSGFKALCTQNLPTPTIGATSTTQANDYMNVVLYTGTGSSNARTGVGFQPDFVWIKERSGAADHGLYDAVRGVQKQIESNRGDNLESTQTTGLTAFNSDGFTVGSLAQLNTNTDTYVAWNWKANGAGSSNTAGTITSTVSANTTSGFSIVTYTGNGTSGATIGHGLGVTPSMIMIRVRNSDQFSWGVYHASVGNTAGLYLNLTNAATTTSVFWNNTSPTSSVFSVGNWGGVNGNTSTYVAYCFAAVAGYSAFGSYTGNGSADGPFVYTGFRPRYVLVKRTDTGGAGFDWFIWDTARSTYNAASANLTANQSVAEGVTAYPLDINSNGLKIRNSATAYNASGGTYIYACFAENPFKYSLAR